MGNASVSHNKGANKRRLWQKGVSLSPLLDVNYFNIGAGSGIIIESHLLIIPSIFLQLLVIEILLDIHFLVWNSGAF